MPEVAGTDDFDGIGPVKRSQALVMLAEFVVANPTAPAESLFRFAAGRGLHIYLADEWADVALPWRRHAVPVSSWPPSPTSRPPRSSSRRSSRRAANGSPSTSAGLPSGSPRAFHKTRSTTLPPSFPARMPA